MPVRAGGVELLGELAGSGYRRAPSLVRRADGQTIQLTPLLYQLLDAIDGRRDHGELATALGERAGRLVTPNDIRFLVESRLRPLGVLRLPDGNEPRVEKPNPLLGLRLRVLVSDPDTTRRITAPFAHLFHPPVVAAVLVAFATVLAWLAFEKGLASAAHQALYEPGMLLLVLGLTLASAAFHELGHAAACRYGGARAGGMGVGLYLVWPAFYTDVTDSYRLSRRGRLRVDLGGLYFNALFAVATVGLWSALRWDALLLVVVAQLIQMVRQLVPIVRFDGYHILADLVGVPDLFAHVKPTLLRLLPGRRSAGGALKPWARAVVTTWVIVVVPLLLALLALAVLLLPRLAASAWDSIGLHWDGVESGWANGDAAAAALGLVSVLTIFLPVAGMTYLIAAVVRRTARWTWRATDGRPTLRAGAALVGALVVATVAYAWWPDGQYRAIEANEQWRLVDLPTLSDRGDAAPAQRGVPKLGGLERASATTAAPQPPAAPDGAPAPVAPPPVAATTRVAMNPPLTAAEPPESTPGTGDAPVAPPSADSPPPAPEPPAPPAPPEPPSGSAPPAAPPAATTPAPGAAGGTTAPASAPATSSAPPARSPETVAAPTTPDPSVAPPPPPSDSGIGSNGWPFPFAAPDPPGAGDNQALAVNTRDGGHVSDVAVDLVEVTDGGPVANRNEAWALARCRNCRTTAVAFQVVLVIGHAEVVTPVNTAVAANYACASCATHALAVQLVTTLEEAPSDAAMGDINRILTLLRLTSRTYGFLPLGEVYAGLLAARSSILGILERDAADEPDPAGTTEATTGGDAGEPAPTATPEPAPAPTTEEGGADAEPEPLPAETEDAETSTTTPDAETTPPPPPPEPLPPPPPDELSTTTPTATPTPDPAGDEAPAAPTEAATDGAAPATTEQTATTGAP